MGILQSHGILLVDSIPTHVPTEKQAKFARLENTLTVYYFNGTGWIQKDLEADTPQTASDIGVEDVNNNFTSTDVEGVLKELSLQVTGLAHTSITNIDLVATANPNEYVVSINWIDGDGVAQSTVDPTPVVINGAEEVEPTGYISKSAAITALGVGKKFQYLAANLDGAVEGTVAWT